MDFRAATTTCGGARSAPRRRRTIAFVASPRRPISLATILRAAAQCAVYVHAGMHTCVPVRFSLGCAAVPTNGADRRDGTSVDGVVWGASEEPRCCIGSDPGLRAQSTRTQRRGSFAAVTSVGRRARVKRAATGDIRACEVARVARRSRDGQKGKMDTSKTFVSRLISRGAATCSCAAWDEMGWDWVRTTYDKCQFTVCSDAKDRMQRLRGCEKARAAPPLHDTSSPATAAPSRARRQMKEHANEPFIDILAVPEGGAAVEAVRSLARYRDK
ncbi:hypothetical protein B0H14DRAFT_2576380 [Mycena olivaceomarginata]|nr:hypothetical protein B0H14DRAFT_2576380 [Mycena olivaceomarginata]